MALNIIFLIVVGASFLSGYRKGIVHMVFFFVGILLGVLSALKLSFLTTELLEGFFEKPQAWIPMASLGINFTIAIWLTNIVANSITQLLKLVFANVINKFMGGAIAAFVAFSILSIVFWYVKNLNVIPEQFFSDSSVFELSNSYAPAFIKTISSITPFFGELFEQLKMIFEQFGQNGTEV